MVADAVSGDRPPTPPRLNQFLREVVASFRDEHHSDAELLSRFVTANDQDAFRSLVVRHGRAVWAVCMAVAGDGHDAEDAFQAVFVAFARRAGALDVNRGAGSWLRAAARRAALKVRRGESRLRRLRARLAADAPTELRATDESHLWVLAAEELERLPRQLREPVVLYHLEGRTFAQVAEFVGCSVAEAHRLVSRGLDRLRTRLSSRGVALNAAVLAAIPAGSVLNSASAAALSHSAAVSPRVAALADAILAPRFPVWSLAAWVTLVAAGTAAAFVAAPAPVPMRPAGFAEPPPALLPDAPHAGSADAPRRPTAAYRGRVTDATGRPVPGAHVAALVRRPWLPGDRGLRDDAVDRVTTDADGRYTITVPADFPTHYPERSVALMVSGPGLPPTTKRVRLGGDADIRVSPTRTVRGVLLAPDGRPAPGVRVGVVRLGQAAAEPVQGLGYSAPGGWPADVTSDADGRFTFGALPSDEDVWVEVRDERFALTTLRIAAHDPAPVRAVLARPRVLEGRVTAADTGRPIAGAKVSAFIGAWENHSLRYTSVVSVADAAVDSPPVEFDTVSGPDGTFRFRLPPTGPYHVSVHPPETSARLGLKRELAWDDERTVRELVVALPLGRVVRGVMRDDTDQPVAGGWVMFQPACGNRELPEGTLVARDAPVRTAPDGSFALVVPPGPGWLEGWGGTPEYRPASHAPRPCPWCGKGLDRTFEHARVRIDPAPRPTGEAGPVLLTLRTGDRAPVRVVGPDGTPVAAGVAVCRSVAQPLRNLVTRPLSICDGTFELPGCEPGRIYPVAFLDPVRLTGAIAEVSTERNAVVKLEACGSVELRLVGWDERPLAGAPAIAALFLDVDRGPRAAPGMPGRWVVDQSWFDPKNQLPRPVTDATGRVTLRALVPGADYVVAFALQRKLYTSAPFRVKPGQTARLPDVVAPFGDRSAPGCVEDPFWDRD